MVLDFTKLLHRPLLPTWETSFEQGPISRIRTLEKEELRSTAKILDIWTRIYMLFPLELTCGPLLTAACNRSLYSGKVLVGEDAKGIAQVFARVIIIPTGLFVEELVTAPWNNAACKKHLEIVGEKEFWSKRRAQEKIEMLLKIKEVSIAELITPHKGSGTIMMLALYHFSKYFGARVISLESNQESMGFYRKLGMQQHHPAHPLFFFNISEETPSVLQKKVSEYFLKHAA